LAVVIFTCLFTFFGRPSTTARVDKIEANSAAAAAGFQVGDIVTDIDGTKIDSFTDMQRIVGTHAGDKLTFTVKRGDSTIQLTGTPQLREMKDGFGNTQRLGVLGITRQTAPGDTLTERVNPATAFWLGIKETWFVIERTLSYIGGIFTGREAADQIGGPLRIAQISGQVATLGLIPLIQLSAVLSISIGLLNLFPVPLLDGGHLLFYTVEAVRGRPLSERAQEMGFRIGLGLVLMLMVFATYHDILRLPGS
jgi:regulator of sigma E protease